MIDALARGAHLPLAMLTLLAGLAIAAGSRDLLKRLLGACAAMLAGVAHLAVLAPGVGMGATLAGVVLAAAGGALGAGLVVRIREGFGGLDGAQVRRGLEEDAEALAREAA